MVERKAELVKFQHPELDIKENLETQELFVTSPNHREQIIIYRPWDKTAFFRVRFESGKEVPTCTGQYTSRKNAVDSVFLYIKKGKKTPHQKQYEMFGPQKDPEDRPVLKRKKRLPKTDHAAESSTANN